VRCAQKTFNEQLFMKPIKTFFVIKPEDLSWRPSIYDENPQRGFSRAHEKRDSRRETLAIPAEEC
jgi:hypothetical protein